MDNFHYTGKVWLVTVLVAPVILLLLLFISNAPTIEDKSNLIPQLSATALLGCTITLYGVILSIPSFLLSWWIVTGVKKMFAKVGIQKLILSAAGAVFIIVTLLIVDYHFFVPLTVQSILWPGAYILVLTGAVFFFSLEK